MHVHMYIHAEENVVLFALGQCEENPDARPAKVSPNGGDGLIGDPHPVAAAKSGASGSRRLSNRYARTHKSHVLTAFPAVQSYAMSSSYNVAQTSGLLIIRHCRKQFVGLGTNANTTAIQPANSCHEC